MSPLRYPLATALLLFALSASAQTTYFRTANGTWSDADGWSPAGIPGPGDAANLNGRTVTVDADATVGVLILPSFASILSGDADLVVTDTLRWELGTATTFTGTLTVGPEGILRVRSVTGLDVFKVGADGVLRNQGRAVWEEPRPWGGTGRFVNEGEVEIPLDLATPSALCFSSVNPAFVNAPGGLIRHTGSGQAYFSCGFNNDGTVRVEEGALELRGFNATGGVDTGAYEVEAGATLRFTGGTRTMSETASVTGAGTVEVTSGSGQTLTLNGSYGVATTRLLPGQGRFHLNSDVTMPALEITGGTLGGSGSVTVTDAFTWTGGKMGGSGTTVIQPDLDISAATLGLEETRTLRLDGTTTWSGETDVNNSAQTVTFVNAGTMLSTGPGERAFFAGTFRNEGLFVHNAGTVRFSSGFDNAGTVEVDGGTLTLQGFNATGGTDTGQYTVADGARLAFTGGVRTLTASAEVSGTGTVVASGPLTNEATWRPGASPGVLTVEGTYPAGSGVLEVELGGPAPGVEFDQLAVTGAATLGGTLRVVLTDGFAPAEGDRFLVVPAASVAGAFAALELPGGMEAFVETTAEGAELVIGKIVATEPSADLPRAFALHAAYPNPFNPRTTLRYDVAEAGPVRLMLYDLRGREVARLVDAERPAGRHEVALDAAGLASGVYLVRLTAEGFAQTRRVTLLR